jgi:ferredoxin
MTSPGVLHLVVCGADGNVYYTSWTESSGWNEWQKIGSSTKDAPAIAVSKATFFVHGPFGVHAGIFSIVDQRFCNFTGRRAGICGDDLHSSFNRAPGDGFVEMDVLVTAIKPPTGHLLAVAVGPFLNHRRPRLRELEGQRLVLGAWRQTERLLSAGILIRDLAGQIEHQTNALGLQRALEIQRQIVLSVPPPLRVVLYRRLMMRIAEHLARRWSARALVTGEDGMRALEIVLAGYGSWEEGRLVLELTGKRAGMEAGLKYLSETGVEVQSLAQDVKWHEDRCTHCTACVSFCPTKALDVERTSMEISFKRDRCIACDRCSILPWELGLGLQQSDLLFQNLV